MELSDDEIFGGLPTDSLFEGLTTDSLFEDFFPVLEENEYNQVLVEQRRREQEEYLRLYGKEEENIESIAGTTTTNTKQPTPQKKKEKAQGIADLYKVNLYDNIGIKVRFVNYNQYDVSFYHSARFTPFLADYGQVVDGIVRFADFALVQDTNDEFMKASIRCKARAREQTAQKTTYLDTHIIVLVYASDVVDQVNGYENIAQSYYSPTLVANRTEITLDVLSSIPEYQGIQMHIPEHTDVLVRPPLYTKLQLINPKHSISIEEMIFRYGDETIVPINLWSLVTRFDHIHSLMIFTGDVSQPIGARTAEPRLYVYYQGDTRGESLDRDRAIWVDETGPNPSIPIYLGSMVNPQTIAAQSYDRVACFYFQDNGSFLLSPKLENKQIYCISSKAELYDYVSGTLTNPKPVPTFCITTDEIVPVPDKKNTLPFNVNFEQLLPITRFNKAKYGYPGGAKPGKKNLVVNYTTKMRKNPDTIPELIMPITMGEQIPLPQGINPKPPLTQVLRDIQNATEEGILIDRPKKYSKRSQSSTMEETRYIESVRKKKIPSRNLEEKIKVAREEFAALYYEQQAHLGLGNASATHFGLGNVFTTERFFEEIKTSDATSFSLDVIKAYFGSTLVICKFANYMNNAISFKQSSQFKPFLLLHGESTIGTVLFSELQPLEHTTGYLVAELRCTKLWVSRATTTQFDVLSAQRSMNQFKDSTFVLILKTIDVFHWLSGSTLFTPLNPVYPATEGIIYTQPTPRTFGELGTWRPEYSRSQIDMKEKEFPLEERDVVAALNFYYGCESVFPICLYSLKLDGAIPSLLHVMNIENRRERAPERLVITDSKYDRMNSENAVWIRQEKNKVPSVSFMPLGFLANPIMLPNEADKMENVASLQLFFLRHEENVHLTQDILDVKLYGMCDVRSIREHFIKTKEPLEPFHHINDKSYPIPVFVTTEARAIYISQIRPDDKMTYRFEYLLPKNGDWNIGLYT